MQSKRYGEVFQNAKKGKYGVFVPFVVVGDPTPEKSFAIISTLLANGADMIELGIPFSDPIADGPIIQAANARALQAGMTCAKAWEIIGEVRKLFPQTPIGLLVYAHLIETVGVKRFFQQAAHAGVDSVLAADIPTLEISPYAKAALEEGISPIMIASDNTPPQHLDIIAKTTGAFTYVVSRYGVTGIDVAPQIQHSRVLAQLQARQAPPCLLGFGIREPYEAREAALSGFAGVICGSVIVDMVAKHLDEPLESLQGSLARFVRRMKDALRDV